MFEKCGLRDIFCGFKRSVWLILAAVIVFGCAGGVKYYGDLKEYQQKQEPLPGDTKVFAGFAYYYLAAANGEHLSATEQKQYVKDYIDLLGAYPAKEGVLKALLEKYSEEELPGLLDPAAYAKGATVDNLWHRSYSAERWSSNNIIRVRTRALDEEANKALMDACLSQLEAIDEGNPDTSLILEGVYYKNAKASSVKISSEDEEEKKPSPVKIVLWAAVGLLLALLISVIRSILFPVINRASDFELYGVAPLGEFNGKTVPLLARVLNKMTDEKDGTVAFVTGPKNAGKLKELLTSLCEEWKKLGRNVCLEEEEETEGKTVILTAVSPDQNAAESDKCEKADLVILAEAKGKSSYSGLDERIQYLKLLSAEPKGAVLISK